MAGALLYLSLTSNDSLETAVRICTIKKSDCSQLPSQFNPVESRENPLWHSQVKLPGVFWQIPFDPHNDGWEPHSLLSSKHRRERRFVYLVAWF